MKEIIKMTRKQNMILLIPFALVVCMIATYFIRNYFSNKQELTEIMLNQIDGVIVKIEDYGKGSFYLEINNSHLNKKSCHTYEIRSFLEDNKIKVGDSVYKKQNSKIMMFYKSDKRGYEKCCEYELKM